MLEGIIGRLTYGIEEKVTALPTSVKLHSNNPNPFNAVTEISFDLNSSTNAKLSIYDINGKEITTLVDGNFAAGTHQAKWNGKDFAGNVVASGIYLYKLSTPEANMTKTLLYVK